MPRFRIRAKERDEERVWDEIFLDEAQLRANLGRRGFTVLAVEQLAEEPAAEAQAPADGPIRIGPEQARVEGDWIYLAPEIAKRHPLYGNEGWAGLMLVLMVLGLLAGVGWFLFFFAIAGARLAWPYLIAAAILAWHGFVTYQMVKERPGFPRNFLALAAAPIVLFGIRAFSDRAPSIASLAYVAIMFAWIFYVIHSKRINVTFRKRVARGDPFLRRLEPPPS